jgi:hypothetical protein
MKNKSLFFYGITLLAAISSQIWLGRLTLLDLSALFWLFFANGYKKIQPSFGSSYFSVGLFYLSSLALLISDIINETSFDVLLKGAGAYFVFPTTVLFLAKNLNKSQLLLVILGSSFISLFFNSDLVESALDQREFKFGLAPFVILLFPVLIDILLKNRHSLMSPLIGTFSLSLLGAWGSLRSTSLIAISALGIIIIVKYSFPSLQNIKIKLLHLALTVLLFPFGIVALSLVFTSISKFSFALVSTEWLSPDAIIKTDSQSQGLLGVVFGGRSQIFSAVSAWLVKPFFGWGSWALDPGGFFALSGLQIAQFLGYSLDESEKAVNLIISNSGSFIPAHSVLWALLVWSGLLGFIPLYIYTCKFFLTIVSGIKYDKKLTYFPVYLGFLILWSLLFSPFGYVNRSAMAIQTAFMICWYQSLFQHLSTVNSSGNAG